MVSPSPYALLVGPVLLPMPVLAIGLLIWMVTAMRVTRGQSLVFVYLFVALSVRFLVNFFHLYTVPAVYFGQSVNSLATLAMIAAGLWVSRNYMLRYRAMLPVYAFMAALIFSALYNGETSGLLNALLRQVLFICVALSFVRVLDGSSRDETLTEKLLAIFLVPLLFQAYSIVFGVTNTHLEADGSRSFMGGYFHEGVFSTMMLCGLAIAVLSSGLTWKRATLYVAIFFAAIIFANYRTSLLAALPLVLGHFVIGSGQGFRKDMAVIVRTSAAIVTVIGVAVLLGAFSTRLADLAVVLQDISSLFRPPTEYDTASRDLMSGRLLIWSDYVFKTITGDASHVLIGFGPDAWEGNFARYAHNVFVSYLYEIGAIGLLVYLIMTLSFLWMAITTRQPRRWAVVACHIGYLILCIGTMPTVNIEGVVLYAIICGYTLYYRLAAGKDSAFIFGESERHFRSRRPRHLVGAAH